MNCNNCGNPITPGTGSCSICGTPVVNNNQVNAQSAMPIQPTVQPQPMVQQPVVSAQPVAPVQPVVNQPQPMSTQQYPGVPGMSGPTTSVQVQQPVQPVGPVFNTVAGVGQNINNKKSGGNGIVIFVILLFLVVVGVGGYFIVDKLQDSGSRDEVKDKKDKDEKDDEIIIEETIEEKEKKYNENIKFIKEIKLFDGKLALVYKNENSDIVGIDVEVEFYDANNGLLGTDTDYTYAPANREFYVIVSNYDVGTDYATYKPNLKATYIGNFEYLEVPQDELKTNDTGEKLTVQYTNNTEKEISSLDVCMVYYNNEEIVQISCSISLDVAPNANANSEFYYSWLKDEGLVYTRYELFANAYIIKKIND